MLISCIIIWSTKGIKINITDRSFKGSSWLIQKLIPWVIHVSYYIFPRPLPRNEANTKTNNTHSFPVCLHFIFYGNFFPISTLSWFLNAIILCGMFSLGWAAVQIQNRWGGGGVVFTAFTFYGFFKHSKTVYSLKSMVCRSENYCHWKAF